MKKLLFSLFFLLATTALMAQAPQRMSYQSIIRDGSNVVVASSAISVKISLLRGTATGPAVYVETHSITTNANGLVSLNIGVGTAITGTFAGIDWSNGPYLIQTATDPTGGTDYSIIGIAPLNSVPYALFSANGTPGPKGDTGAMGAAGTNGTNGLEGTAGVQGPTGIQGPIGPQGPAGANGLSVSSADFVDLTTNQIVAGEKTFSSDLTVNGVKVGLGPNAISSNTVLGNNTFSANVSGSDNTVMGKSALRSNTTGSYNTATGVNVLYSNTTGNFNTASGRDALFANLTGNYNTASGYASLAGNTGGQFNTATGESALFANTVGNYNTATGLYSLRNNVTGSNNTALGYNADVASGALNNATAIGNGAIVTTSNTIQLGADGTNGITAVTNVKTSGTLTAGAVTYPNTHGGANQVLTTTGTGTLTWATPSGGVPYTGAAQGVDLGAYDLKVNGLNMGKGGGSINNNTAFGNSSLGINSTGSVNTAAGFESLKSNTSGEANTAFGAYALRENQNGARNTAVGSQALQLTNGAYDNTAIGALSAVSNTTGNNNVAIGSKSLQSNTAGRDNIAVGFEALYLNQANGNTASGYQSMRQNIGGGRNTALGYTALYSNTTASFNVAVGAQALGGTTTGERNVAIGAGALDENRTGSYNTVLGGFAGRYIANGSSSALDGGSDGASPNTIMDNSILIGAWTKPKANNETNQIVIGYNAIGNGSNTIQLGNTGITNVKTSGTLTAGAVTYPNVDGSANQVLSTNGSGTLAWSTSNGLPTTGNTAGDMLYWNGSTNAWVKVAAGSNGQTLTFYNGAPAWVETTANANTVFNPQTGKIWMDRNLGASQVATSSTDAASYGDLYQWGRGADGHQIRTSGTTTTLSTTDAPGNGNFILAPNSPYDWRSSKEDNLWQGVSGVNNPCPTGYRIPTDAEWDAERLSWGSSSQNAAGALASPLKLPMAGYRSRSIGSLLLVGTNGLYWSSTVSSSSARSLDFDSSNAAMVTGNRASGFSVRCLKD
uniref:FISUMP domain-containing protein n=3 Tax=Algoriphagus sp. TaxID=1872435 RepID=UPI004047DFC0